jgi:predicted  nucleic acid-binding Zn-ribbon protein
LEDSCFCPKASIDSSARSTNENFEANHNFWKYFDSTASEYRTKDKNIFDTNFIGKDDPEAECPLKDSNANCNIDSSVPSDFIAYTIGDDDNISKSLFSTKKVNTEYSFTISAIDDSDNSKVKDFNGTLCFKVFDSDNETSWSKLSFNDENTTDANVTVAFSSKRANYKFKWKQDEDKDCADADSEFDDSGDSQDSFAIIPVKFLLEVDAKVDNIIIKAGESYDLNITAVDDSNGTVTTYVQTFVEDGSDKNVTLFFEHLDATLEQNTTYDYDINGSGTKSDFNISDVGVYIISIKDMAYANVDSNDTNEADRMIEGNLTITVNPYLFDLNITTHRASTGQDWAYMSQEENESAWQNDMNYTIKATLTARNKQNETTIRFDKSEYATDVTTSVVFDTNLSSADETKLYKQFDGDFDIATGEFNTTKSSFIKGVREFSLVYRMDKNTTKAFEPIRTNIKNFNLTDIGDSNKTITAVDDNITWYYSKLKTYSIRTSEETVTNKFFITVYKEDTKNFKQVSLNWYKNDSDDGITTAFDFNASHNSAIDNKSNHTVDNISYDKGKVDFDITKTTDGENAIIHIGTPKYFWYSYGIDTNYSYKTGSNCSQHPCSTYVYIKDGTGNTIGSGTNTGSTIEVKDRGSYTKKGVKVFR